jgi:hypothetical protein
MTESVSYLATDVGLWMALPAFGPAFLIVAVVIYVVRRDRREDREGDGLAGDSDAAPGIG